MIQTSSIDLSGYPCVGIGSHILNVNKRHRAMIKLKQTAPVTSEEKCQNKVKRFVTSTILFSGLALVTTVAHSEIINLDFTLYTNQLCSGNCSFFENNPIVSDYLITLVQQV